MRTTTDGPHRAELAIRVDGHVARDVLSRGQQKLLVYLMHLAQLDVLGESGTRPVVLCDDLGSELDERAGAALLDALVASGSQVFVSGTALPGRVAVGPFHEPPDRGPGDGAGPDGAKGAKGADGASDADAPDLAGTASDTTLSGTENPDPPRPHAVFALDGGRLRT